MDQQLGKNLAVLRSKSSSATQLGEREIYYKKAFDTILKSDKPTDLLWPLLVTWTEIITMLPDRTDLQLPWIKFLTTLGFAGKDYLIRLEAFDSFLDFCETLVMGNSAAGG